MRAHLKSHLSKPSQHSFINSTHLPFLFLLFYAHLYSKFYPFVLFLPHLTNTSSRAHSLIFFLLLHYSNYLVHPLPSPTHNTHLLSNTCSLQSPTFFIKGTVSLLGEVPFLAIFKQLCQE